MAGFRHPFADKQPKIEEDIDLDDEAVGEENATDTGSSMDEEISEEEESLTASLKKNDDGITVHQYIKQLSDDQYYKMIGKDAYAFLSGNKSDLYELFTVGRNVADEFKTLNTDQVKEVYSIIVNKLVNEPHWTTKEMTEELTDKFPFLDEYEAKRIIKTELGRIIDYAREYEAKREGLSNYYYGWMGPLDYRTTPMCYYLQTGKLREKDKKALEKAGHSESDLPIIPKEGLLLEDLRTVVRQVAECFGFEMISDWQPHINCRHTFVRGDRALEPELPDLSDDIDVLISTRGDTQTAIGQEAEEDVNYIQTDSDGDTLVFANSIYGKPTMFDSGSDYYYVFEEEDENTVYSTARMTEQLVDEGLSIETITWAIQDTINMSDGDVGYITAHYDDILAMLNMYM